MFQESKKRNKVVIEVIHKRSNIRDNKIYFCEKKKM